MLTSNKIADTGPYAVTHTVMLKDCVGAKLLNETHYSALVVMGSQNAENRFGIQSGKRVAQALKNRGWQISVSEVTQMRKLMRNLKAKKFEVVVPVGFGLGSGEDGTIYTLAKAFGLPCAGPGSSCGAICTDKFVFQSLVDGLFSSKQASGPLLVKTPKTVLITRLKNNNLLRDEIKGLHLPILLKPVCGGSSIGIEVVRSHDEAIHCASRIKRNNDRFLAQEYIHGREISVTLVDRPGGVLVCPLVELNKGGSLIMGYKEKFDQSANSRHIIPAPFANAITEAIKNIVLRLHDHVGFRGITRVDAIVRENQSEIVILEANPIAGLLESSIAVDAAYAAGIDFEELAEEYALTAFQDS